jgi:hypothetical protein
VITELVAQLVGLAAGLSVDGNAKAADIARRGAERIAALEEIRQRVADGWKPMRGNDSEPDQWWCVLNDERCDRHPATPLSPEVASLLWPEDTST